MKRLPKLKEYVELQNSILEFLNEGVETEVARKVIGSNVTDAANKVTDTVNDIANPEANKVDKKEIINSTNASMSDLNSKKSVIFKEIQYRYFKKTNFLEQAMDIFFRGPINQKALLEEANRLSILMNGIAKIRNEKVRNDLKSVKWDVVLNDSELKDKLTDKPAEAANDTSKTSNSQATTTSATPEQKTLNIMNKISGVSEGFTDSLTAGISSAKETGSTVYSMGKKIGKNLKSAKDYLFGTLLSKYPPFNYYQLYKLIMESRLDEEKTKKFLEITYDMLGKGFLSSEASKIGVKNDGKIDLNKFYYFNELFDSDNANNVLDVSKKITTNVVDYVITNSKNISTEETPSLLSGDYYKKVFLTVDIFLMTVSIGLFNILVYFIELYGNNTENGKLIEQIEGWVKQNKTLNLDSNVVIPMTDQFSKIDIKDEDRDKDELSILNKMRTILDSFSKELDSTKTKKSIFTIGEHILSTPLKIRVNVDKSVVSKLLQNLKPILNKVSNVDEELMTSFFNKIKETLENVDMFQEGGTKDAMANILNSLSLKSQNDITDMQNKKYEEFLSKIQKEMNNAKKLPAFANLLSSLNKFVEITNIHIPFTGKSEPTPEKILYAEQYEKIKQLAEISVAKRIEENETKAQRAFVRNQYKTVEKYYEPNY